jgi:Stress responsive A/B Barrel Domain
MFRHVVCFAWIDSVTDEQVEQFSEMLAGLPARIPELRGYSFGSDAGVAAGNFDFALVADFDDTTGWRAYQEHPDHRRVIEFVRPLIRSRAAVQYEAPLRGP